AFQVESAALSADVGSVLYARRRVTKRHAARPVASHEGGAWLVDVGYAGCRIFGWTSASANVTAGADDEKQRLLGPKSPSCHAPALARNVTEHSVKLLAAWDAAVARSRTSLLRQLRFLLREWRAPLGHSDLP